MSLEESEPGNIAEFFREVTKYFMDFLETDFRKRRAPRRQSRSRNQDNLLIGIRLGKYASLRTQVVSALRQGFPATTRLEISKGQHRTNLPLKFNELLERQVTALDPAALDHVLNLIADEIQSQALINADHVDLAINQARESAGAIIYEGFVRPLTSKLEKPIKSLEFGGFSEFFVIEKELTEVLLGSIDSAIAKSVSCLITGVSVEVMRELTGALNLSDLQLIINSYFSELKISDLYLELFELDRNQSILEKQDIYLYLGEIGFREARYPIYYMPLTISREGEKYVLNFDSQIYVNKKAIEFIVQEVHALHDTHGGIRSITERIIYLSNLGKTLHDHLQQILVDICAHFRVNGTLDLLDQFEKTIYSTEVQVTNHFQLALFDKADESLVNDYEEILEDLATERQDLSLAFNQILEDFLLTNPESFERLVEDEWDDLETSEKLVSPNPIPLNSEQRQILLAVRKPGCKYVSVEGPPGTGKSHTITAIVFDAILRDQSVLVLSDKKEALDVVEKNITETMNRVRTDSDFQNPILRLGKTGNTYGKILTKSSISSIKTHQRVVRRQETELSESIDQSIESLREDLEIESLAYQDIDLREIDEYLRLASEMPSQPLFYDLNEVSNSSESVTAFSELRDGLKAAFRIRDSIELKLLLNPLGLKPDTIEGFCSLMEALKRFGALAESWRCDPQKLAVLTHLPKVDELTTNILGEAIKRYTELRSPIFGYRLAKRRVQEIDKLLLSSFGSEAQRLCRDIDKLEALQINLKKLDSEVGTIAHDHGLPHIFTSLVHEVICNSKLFETLKLVASDAVLVVELENNIRLLPNTWDAIAMDFTGDASWLLTLDDLTFEKHLRFVQLHQQLTAAFGSLSDVNFLEKKQSIEALVTTQVAHKLDGQVINFVETRKNDAEMLRSVIKNKQKFPKNEFGNLRLAFPCILSGIRDFAEYIPLQSQVFDLLIIDEASQVSIAQAFPALIRAKKVLILGDKKQFSNVKSSQARSDTNREYLFGLENSFRRNVSEEIAQLTRLGKFNVKTSVLEFLEFISNYGIQLVKHFRGYKEIISYSNKYFYSEKLQVMKLRSKPIDEVIKFSYVETEEGDEPYPNSNLAEIRFLAGELSRLLEENSKLSVGIITPHTNQQKLIVEQLGRMGLFPRMLSDLKLKIMTFDTCQGEERDLIFYSMVASKESDKLWGVFIKNLSDVDIEEDGQIKAQRLNVGFSRAKECVHFVLSKPIDQFVGSIGEALRHYQQELLQAKEEYQATDVDPSSPMEAQVLHWFYQTDFWRSKKDHVHFVPQFEIGKYLKQLDPHYSHPKYKVDFLVSLRNDAGKEIKVILEYDGFEEHFKSSSLVNSLNFEQYLSDDDVYRQKVLESYGYRFIRLNRFNIGADPVRTLDRLLLAATETGSHANHLVEKIQDTIAGISNGDLKECPKCKDLRPAEAFQDPKLRSGVGRICDQCKTQKEEKRGPGTSSRRQSSSSRKVCSKCGSRLVLRKGPYGSFYGCSRFPYCRGTR